MYVYEASNLLKGTKLQCQRVNIMDRIYEADGSGTVGKYWPAQVVGTIHVYVCPGTAEYKSDLIGELHSTKNV
jgi:hypothetical protein